MMLKPRFYKMDLDNYNEDFLKEIIRWYADALESLKERILEHKTIETEHFSCDGLWKQDILKIIDEEFQE